MRALALSREGWPQKDIAAALGVSKGAVSQWLARARDGGAEALRARPAPGRPPQLTSEQRAAIPDLLLAGAETRIRVLDVVSLHRRGLTPVEILDSYDHLTLAQVHAALAFYYDHKAEVDAQFSDVRRREEEIRERHPGLAR